MFIAPPGKGRRPAPLDYRLVKELTGGDIAEMWTEGAGAAPTIKALRYNHHLLAKAVASGKSLMECSQLSGLTVARVSVLKADPAFQELVSFYAEELHEVYVDVHSRMAALGTSVLEELQDRFEDAPEKFTKKELLELFTTMADRSIPTAKGGPKQQAALTLGPNGGLALQINFVNAQGEGDTPTQVIPLPDGASAQQVLSPPQTQAPAALPPQGPTSVQFDLDGEPYIPPTRTQPPPEAIQEARFANADRPAREAAERDALRAALQRLQGSGEEHNGQE